MEEKILGKDAPFPRGWTICSSSFNPDRHHERDKAIEDCKSFILNNNLTQEDVRIIQEDNSILVVTKCEVYLK